MRRRLHIAEKGRDGSIRIAEGTGRVVCTLPYDEGRLARFIVRAVNLLGFGLRRRDRSDWLWERDNRRA